MTGGTRSPCTAGCSTKAGINIVDAATLVAEARHKYPISMFPRGGTHWNMLAAALAAQALTDKLNSLQE